MNKAPDAFRTISEVADELDLPQHVLRFWESRFPHIRPMKRGGGRRYYRPEDIDLLRGIQRLLYSDGYTIRGVQRILREKGVRTVQSVGQGQAPGQLGPLPDDARDEDEGPNGVPALLKFSSPPDSNASDGTEDDTEDAEPDRPAPIQSAPQNRPIAEADSGAMASVSRTEATQVHQAAPLNAAAPPKGLASADVERLKHALAELEACRRLLDKANKGGR